MIRASAVLLSLVSLVGCATPNNYYSWPTKDTNFYFEGVPIEGKYLYQNVSSSPRPTVIVAHGCDGAGNRSYREWVDILSSWGYNGIMIDSFSPRGYSNMEVCSRGTLVTPEMRSTDINKLISYIKSQPWHKGKIGLIGFSHGGSTAINFANSDRVSGISAAVAYYPSCYNTSFNFVGTDWKNPKIPFQVHFGEKDKWTPPEWCDNFEKYEKYYYKNATHAFDMNMPSRTIQGHFLAYDSNADRTSRMRTREFFNKHLLK